MPLINRDLPTPPAWPPPTGQETIGQLLSFCRRRDPVGHLIHTWLALAYLALLPLSTPGKDVALGLLVGYTLLRLPNIWRCYTPLVFDRFLWIFLTWALVHGLSILWSVDQVEGLTELKAFRVIVVPLALWPVLDRLPWLIGAFLVGVFGLNIVQGMQRLELFGLTLEGDDRARGGLHPIQTGAFCLAALTWYVPALVRLRWRGAGWLMRAGVTFAGAGAAGLGLVFSGSRGSWLAGLVVLPIAWLVLFVRLPDRRGVAAGVAGLAVLGGAIIWFAGGGVYMQSRIAGAIEEYEDAVKNQDHRQGVGQRIVMTRWAWSFFTQSPLAGKGAGSFRALSKETTEFKEMETQSPGRARNNRFTPAHPHSAYLHVISSTGLIGLIPFVATLVVLLVRAGREPLDHLFAGAALFVLLGWMIGTLFDCYDLNGHLFGLFALVAVVVIRHRPTPSPHWNWQPTEEPGERENA